MRNYEADHYRKRTRLDNQSGLPRTKQVYLTERIWRFVDENGRGYYFHVDEPSGNPSRFQTLAEAQKREQELS